MKYILSVLIVSIAITAGLHAADNASPPSPEAVRDMLMNTFNGTRIPKEGRLEAFTVDGVVHAASGTDEFNTKFYVIVVPAAGFLTPDVLEPYMARTIQSTKDNRIALRIGHDVFGRLFVVTAPRTGPGR